MGKEYAYEDILHLSRPVVPWRACMTRGDRAAQFAPFAALTGYEAAVAEAGRLTDRAAALEQDRIEELDRMLQSLAQQASPRVRLTVFQPDKRKEGGAYVQLWGVVRRVDGQRKCLVLEDGRQLFFDRIYALEQV